MTAIFTFLYRIVSLYILKAMPEQLQELYTIILEVMIFTPHADWKWASHKMLTVFIK